MLAARYISPLFKRGNCFSCSGRADARPISVDRRRGAACLPLAYIISISLVGRCCSFPLPTAAGRQNACRRGSLPPAENARDIRLHIARDRWPSMSMIDGARESAFRQFARRDGWPAMARHWLARAAPPRMGRRPGRPAATRGRRHASRDVIFGDSRPAGRKAAAGLA